MEPFRQRTKTEKIDFHFRLRHRAQHLVHDRQEPPRGPGPQWTPDRGVMRSGRSRKGHQEYRMPRSPGPAGRRSAARPTRPPWSRHSGLERVRLRREGSLRRDHPERPVDVVDVELHPLCYRPTEPNAGQPCFLAKIFATPRPRHEPVLRRRSGRGSSGLNQRSQPNAACHRESRTNLRSASPTSSKSTMDTCPRPENRKPPSTWRRKGAPNCDFGARYWD